MHFYSMELSKWCMMVNVQLSPNILYIVKILQSLREVFEQVDVSNNMTLNTEQEIHLVYNLYNYHHDRVSNLVKNK